jgi:N-acetylmuramoyl-L-alanine amidase
MKGKIKGYGITGGDLRMKMVASALVLALSIAFFPTMVGQAESFYAPYDVILDIGHGGVDGGTSRDGVFEKDINLAIGKKLYDALEREKIVVGITRVRDYALSEDSKLNIRSRHSKDLNQRKLIADALQPKIFISLHVNWSEQGLKGPLVIYQPDHKSYALAQILQRHLNEWYGSQKKAVRGRKYFILKNIKQPTVIVEMGYLSHYRDFRLMTEEKSQDQLVAAMVRAIKEYLLIHPA